MSPQLTLGSKETVEILVTGLANATHIILGAGLVLLIMPKRKKVGTILILIAALMHAVAFFS